MNNLEKQVFDLANHAEMLLQIAASMHQNGTVECVLAGHLPIESMAQPCDKFCVIIKNVGGSGRFVLSFGFSD